MKHEIEIHAIRSRPRFKVVAKMAPEEFSRKMKTHLENHNKTLGGYVNSEISLVYVKQDQDKLWAPQLQIRIERHERKSHKIFIRGLFGPRTSIWTFFMFSYILGGAILLTTGVYGWIELALGVGSFWVWTNVLGIILILGPYLSAKIGQRLARSHISVLRTFIETVLVEENIIETEES